MPKDQTIISILVIGSGPIVIGQAAEFDYAGTQACMALKEEGYKVILVNNNPATIMTDHSYADTIYFEPLTVDSLEKIIMKERPDGLLASLGGQTGLNLAMALSETGVLEKYKVKMLGSPIASIKKGEDREEFRQLMKELDEPVPDSEIVREAKEAKRFAEASGFPIIVRPAYTLGGSGGGIAHSMEEFMLLVEGGLLESPISQCLVEKSIAGYKEIEYEVMRDKDNTCITICNMENIDPVGVHTGDSIVIAPSQTLTDEEYQMLRSASIKIISALGIIGGCNIQFALDPESKKYYLIEVNPRVSRSSALASKATGYPIARMAAKLAVGYSLSELLNPVTGDTYASFEPALDYVVVKFPRWPFDKFTEADRRLGTQMKATGEVMGIDRNIERALLKAVQSLEAGNLDLESPGLGGLTDDSLITRMKGQTDERFFIVMELLRRGHHIQSIHELTKIDLFYLQCFAGLASLEKEIASCSLETVCIEQMQVFKEKGFSDEYLASVWKEDALSVRKKRKQLGILPSYKMVDTCAAEFEAQSNYYYSSYYGENEQLPSENKKVLIIGSGPIRIGQGIEFDYCSVHGVFALKAEGIETVMINNNPETVSTDFATADRLYFEPLTPEAVLNVADSEGIKDVIVQLGGQTALNLADKLEKAGLNLLGTRSAVIDDLEDRDLFYRLLDRLKIPRIKGETAAGDTELREAAERIGYPVLIRPSFVIGGKGMHIIRSSSELSSFLEKQEITYPVLCDQFLHAAEAELDLAADGDNILVPVIMEHIEKTGVHSGDSLSVLPAQSVSGTAKKKMFEYGKKIVKDLAYKGLMNIQYIVDGEEVYLLEVNPRASRTVPVVSKVANVPLVQIATKILLGKYKLPDSEGPVYDNLPFVCVKYPVFSNYALKGLDPKTSPEMRSTGEGIALASSLNEAVKKAFHKEIKPAAAAVIMTGSGETDRMEGLDEILDHLGITVQTAGGDRDMDANILAVFSRGEAQEDFVLREFAVKNRLPVFTQPETLYAFLESLQVKEWGVCPLQEWHNQIIKDVTLV
ncbi:carbamoyl phosphate synthase large subunit [Bacillus infantis]|uniref:carbamoyl phosphate synthase large subunit n=1 Tax=Bacillus infantis TaxID=324767 RepID=UPI003CF8B419